MYHTSMAFGNKCFIHNYGKKNLSKFDTRSDKDIFVGYYSVSKVYRVYNKSTNVVINEFIHVVFDETNNGLPSRSAFDEFQLSKYTNDEHKGVHDKCNHRDVPINFDPCPN